jgi:hypothetical protein
MLNFCGIVAAILKMATGRNFSMSGHHYLPTYQILMISDNVEILKMQNCSSNGDLSLCQILCLYHYLNWFPALKNLYRSPCSKWPPQCCTNATLSDFKDISYVCRLWCPELIPDIEKFLPVTIFKWPPQNRTNSTLFDFNEISYVGRLWCPELIPDIEKFLLFFSEKSH